MLVVFFPKNARAGKFSYLVEHRRDRVVAIVGLAKSFELIASLSESENPTTTGAVCFEREVETDQALRIARFWLYDLILGGADIAAIPHVFVIHREVRSDGGYRTAVHFVILNYHLGLRLAIRPYLDRIDRPWFEYARREMNRHYNFRDPDDCVRVVIFSRACFDADQSAEEQVAIDAEKWVLANGDKPSNKAEVEARLNDYLADLRTSFADLSDARLVTKTNSDDTFYSIQLDDSRLVYLCCCPSRSPKPPPTLPLKADQVDFAKKDIDDWAVWCRESRLRQYKQGWVEPRFAPDLDRREMYDLDKKWATPFGKKEQDMVIDEFVRELNQPRPPIKKRPDVDR